MRPVRHALIAMGGFFLSGTACLMLGALGVSAPWGAGSPHGGLEAPRSHMRGMPE